MFEYHHAQLTNPWNLDLSALGDYGIKAAFAIGCPFVQQVGFGADAVAGVHIATNGTFENDFIESIIRATNRIVDKWFEGYGVPIEAIVHPRPTWGNEGRQKLMTDLNPYSPTYRKRKRMNIAKHYRCLREEGRDFFEWHSTATSLLPREGDMPLDRLNLGPFRRAYGSYAKIRNDLLQQEAA